MELKASKNKNIIHHIRKNSIAEDLGIQAGDLILSLNGVPVEDTIEYSYLEADEYVELEIQHQDGEIVIYEIEKDFDEELGLEFSNPIIDEVKSCSNKCIFCFIDQLPKGMRETLYIKDDDSRLSFLQGNFITMTNMKDRDIDKLVQYRISPINISVHTTNPELRVRMLKNRFASKINENIEKLASVGIVMNGQIVCIPEVNDKKELERTIRDLVQYYPQMESVAVVPVGLTKYRDGLAPLKLFDKESSLELIEQIEGYQKEFYQRYGTRFVFASDEFYVTAQKELPSSEEYEDYIQLENGVGLIKKLESEIKDELSNLNLKAHGCFSKITIATGYSAFDFMSKMAKEIMKKISVEIQVIKIRNDFFGETITVAGLITGGDLIKQLKDIDLGDALFLPRVMFRADELVFLDDLKIPDIEKALDTSVVVNEINGNDLIRNILEGKSL
ncbi:MAG: DUF512 domain-containing protein [Peptostreptococcaceae bacterium]|nr:DUF512 domain-containing protein [Peptostreptococcaceae bacterium]